MEITFYGVRGSIPVPGAGTVRYGGNTPCVFVRLCNGRHLIFDAGTGLRLLARRMMGSPEPVNLLLSHGHWDHIQGFPFFSPIYQQGREIRVFPNAADGYASLVALLGQMNGAAFPVHRMDLPSRIQCVVGGDQTVLADEGIALETLPLNHPGGGRAFKVIEEGTACAYITDNEIDPPYTPATAYEDWVRFCRGVDVLIHDAQYVEADMPHKHGWGHSLVSQACRLALDAEVRLLVLFHHDPDRTDAELDQIQRESLASVREADGDARVVCAHEGLVIALSCSATGGRRPAIALKSGSDG